MEMCLSTQEPNKETVVGKNKRAGSCQTDLASKTKTSAGIIQEQSRASIEIDTSSVHIE